MDVGAREVKLQRQTRPATEQSMQAIPTGADEGGAWRRGLLLHQSRSSFKLGSALVNGANEETLRALLPHVGLDTIDQIRAQLWPNEEES